MVKDSTGVRSPQRKLAPDKYGLGERERTSLRGISRTGNRKKEHRFENLYGLLNEGMLHLAWRQLNRWSSIADKDMSVKQYAENLADNLKTLNERLKAKSYRAKLVRRTYIEKDNGKQRPLGIPSLDVPPHLKT